MSIRISVRSFCEISIKRSYYRIRSIVVVSFSLPLSYTWSACVCLIKPQFEAGREKVGKKGVVRDLSTHKEVVKDILNFAYETGFSVLGLDFSPVKGPEGNIEYLMYLKKENEPQFNNFDIDAIVDASHNTLNSGE